MSPHEKAIGVCTSVAKVWLKYDPDQAMTEAEHNRPIPKLFSNRPSASAAKVFGLLREPIIFFENNMWNFIESEFHT